MEPNRAVRQPKEPTRKPRAAPKRAGNATVQAANLMASSPQTTVAGSLTGAAAGAAGGMIAGPPGVIAGAAIGAAIGAMAGAAIGADQQDQNAKDEALDREIGVIGDNLGEARPDQPPARIGAYSAPIGPADRATRSETPSEGPIPSAGSDKG